MHKLSRENKSLMQEKCLSFLDEYLDTYIESRYLNKVYTCVNDLNITCIIAEGASCLWLLVSLSVNSELFRYISS